MSLDRISPGMIPAWDAFVASVGKGRKEVKGYPGTVSQTNELYERFNVVALDVHDAIHLMGRAVRSYLANKPRNAKVYWRVKPELVRQERTVLIVQSDKTATYEETLWSAYCRLLVSNKRPMTRAVWKKNTSDGSRFYAARKPVVTKRRKTK